MGCNERSEGVGFAGLFVEFFSGVWRMKRNVFAEFSVIILQQIHDLMPCMSVNFHLTNEVQLRPSMGSFLLLMVRILPSGFLGFSLEGF